MYRHKTNYSTMTFFDNLWWVNKLQVWLPVENISKNEMFSSDLKCKSLRAFRRRLKGISKKQPELKGRFVYLNSLFLNDKSIKMKIK